MKAAVFHKPGQPMLIENQPDPMPGPGQVVLKVSHCGICGSDLHMTDGQGSYTAPPGSVLGHEYSGVVTAVGADVDKLKPGDRVTAMPFTGCGKCDACREGESHWCSEMAWLGGGYAEYALAGAASCIKLPGEVTLLDAALVEPMAVALHAIKLANVRPGTKLVVLGAGTIGLASVYWARHFGCENIAVGAASTRHADLAATMGATSFFINDDRAVETAAQQLGAMPDIVVECVGMPGMIARSIDLVKRRGTIVVPGWCWQQDSFLPMIAVRKELRMLFSVLYSRDEYQYVVDTMAAGKDSTFRAMVTDTTSLQALPQIFEALRERSRQCKVMVEAWR